MGNMERVAGDFDEIKGVLLALPGPAATRCGGSALDDDDTMVPIGLGVNIERISDVSAMQVPTENHLDTEFDEVIHGSFGLRHDFVPFVVWCRSEMMVGDHDFGDPAGVSRKASLQKSSCSR